MIAHRLSTIMTADHLLFLKEPNEILGAAKDTEEYNEIIENLKQTNYKHQQAEQAAAIDEVVDRFRKSEKGKRPDMTTNEVTTVNTITLEDLQKIKQTASTHKKDRAAATGYARIFQFYQPKWMAVCMIFTALIMSMSFPVLGLLTSSYQYIIIDWESPEFEERRLIVGLSWLGLCFLIGGISAFEKGMFGTTGENLTANVRKALIRGVLYKQLSWFDSEKRAPGILTNVFSEDVASLNGMTTETASTVIEAGLGLGFGVLVALFINWRMALCTIAVSPILLVGVVAMSRLQWGNKRGKNTHSEAKVDQYEKASAVLSDVIMNYKTVIAFGDKNVEQVVKKF